MAGRLCHRFCAAALLTLLPVFLVGCDDDPIPLDAGTGYQCERDEEMLADQRECVRDEGCPCGAHCELGRCVYECLDDSECESGELCSPFGRCGGGGLTPPLGAGHAGTVTAEETLLEFPAPGTVRQMRLQVEGADTGPMRLVASDGVQVQCEPDGDYSDECMIESPTTSEQSVYNVRSADSPVAEDTTSDVRIFLANERVTVRCRRWSMEQRAEERPEGIYRGTLSLVAAGSSDRAEEEELPEELAALSLPVTVTVFPGEGGVNTVRIADDLGALFPQPGPDGMGGAVGQLVYDSGEATWSLQMPSREFLSTEHAEGPLEAIEIWIPEVDAPAEWVGITVSADLATTFEGLVPTAYSPFLTWQLDARHVEYLADGPTTPEVPAGFTPTLDPSRGTTPFAVEDAAWGALGTVPLAGLDQAGLAQAMMCSMPDAAEPGTLGTSLYEVELTGGDTFSPSGDVVCGDTEAPETFGLLRANNLNLMSNLESCRNDLLGIDATGSPLAALTSNDCVDASRVIASLGAALEPELFKVLDEAQFTPDETASALGHRQLQQWLLLMSFLSREASRMHDLGEILSDASGSAIDVSETLVVSAEAWDLLLHPRFAIPIATFTPAVYASPDYRDYLPDVDDGPAYDMNVGLPVGMMDAARAQSEVVARLIESVVNMQGATTEDEVRLLSGEVLPRVFLAFALGHQAHARAATGAEPEWEEDWQNARRGAAAGLRALLRVLDRLNSGENTLGIENGDLPLYQIGDQETAMERFFALTSYLLGSEDATQPGVAQYMVARAQDDLDDVRDAWVANVERDLAQELNSGDTDRRLEENRVSYGTEINSLCGALPWDNDEVLDHWDEINPRTCWVDPSCQAQLGDLSERATAAAVGYALCVTHCGRVVLGNREHVMLALVGETMFGDYTPDQPFPMQIVSSSSDFVTVRLNTGYEYDYHYFRYDRNELLTGSQGEEISQEDFDAIFGYCRAGRQATLDARPSVAPASCTVTDECPSTSICRDGTCQLDVSDELNDDPSCYRGAIGSQALAVRAAALEVESVRAEIGELSEAWGIAVEECSIMSRFNAAEEALRATTNGILTVLNGLKFVVDSVSVVSSTAMEACEISVPGAGAMAAITAMADTASLALELAMDELERYTEMALEFMQNAEDEAICWNNTRENMVGLRSLTVQLEQAQADLQREFLEFQMLQGDVGDAVSNGHAAVVNEENRRTTPISTNFWIDSALSNYQRSMRQARRVTYLAAMATEYELQQTVGERDDILAAVNPDDLQEAIDRLRNVARTGTVGGAAPALQLDVISLRDHLLRLQDTSIYPGGWHRMNEEELFQVLLTSPSYASYDEEGTYLGQEIPFSIVPLGTLGLDGDGGIPLLAGMNCAERLWSVNASLQGDDLYTGDDATFTRIILRKRNSFFSQWCDEDAESPFQAASTRPSRNLFIDPLDIEGDYVSSMPTPDGDASDEVNSYTNARIAAYFNVSRAELEDEAYFNGDSQELAARGLFGDYALFFPAEILNIDDSGGLELGNVTNILLRLDSVSAARN